MFLPHLFVAIIFNFHFFHIFIFPPPFFFPCYLSPLSLFPLIFFHFFTFQFTPDGQSVTIKLRKVPAESPNLRIKRTPSQLANRLKMSRKLLPTSGSQRRKSFEDEDCDNEKKKSFFSMFSRSPSSNSNSSSFSAFFSFFNCLNVFSSLKSTSIHHVDELENCNGDDPYVHGMLVMDVIDAGAGMAPEDSKRLFKEIIQFNPSELQVHHHINVFFLLVLRYFI